MNYQYHITDIADNVLITVKVSKIEHGQKIVNDFT